MSGYATKKFKTKQHGQNPIQWVNYLSKDDIDTYDNVKQSHRHASTLTCTKKLKNRSYGLTRMQLKLFIVMGHTFCHQHSVTLNTLVMSLWIWKEKRNPA